ncbi:STAS domain-containing protein [Rhodobacteraceae bacterium D3-12]|nr:STAS domain-containing protein [Rhodobacteraceae bacterium D3-12]
MTAPSPDPIPIVSAHEASQEALREPLSEGVHLIKLPARLDYAACEHLAEALDAARGQAVQIAAQDVSRLGTMPVELLLRARLRWQAEGRGFGLGQTSEAFDAGIAMLGLTRAQFETGESATGASA